MDVLDSFDLVAVQDWTGYASRREFLCRELDRLGLLGRAQWFWRAPSPFTSMLSLGLPVSGGPSLAGFDCTMGHYEIMKLALAWGCKRVLVMEDDACFADAGLVRASLTAAPSNWSGMSAAECRSVAGLVARRGRASRPILSPASCTARVRWRLRKPDCAGRPLLSRVVFRRGVFRSTR